MLFIFGKNFLSTSTAVLIMHLNRVFILKDILIYIIFVPTVFILKYSVHFFPLKLYIHAHSLPISMLLYH